MLKNYLKIALRNLMRHKAYSLINVSGLAIGMACSILILLWVRNEISYDRFHKDAGRIYRVTANASEFRAAVNPAGMPGGLKREMPAIESFTRLSHLSSTLFQAGEKKFLEKDVFYADSNFLETFTFPLKEGNAATALARRDAVLLTEEMAVKYFGKTAAIGQTLKRNNGDLVTVTGVVASIPSNTHLSFDFIMPIQSITETNRDLRENVWDNFNFYTYLKLDKSVTPGSAAAKAFEKQMNAIYQKREPEVKINFNLQPLTDIHLHSNLQVDLPGHGNIQYVNILLVVAIFILVVACINFMNLATARSARRAREVGIRKVAGAYRGQLIRQFLGESMVISFLSLFIALGFVFLVLPVFNQIAGKKILLSLSDGKLWLGLIAMTCITGLISGSYPAVFLSGFVPAKVLKGTLRKSGGSLLFRNGLVVTQFVVSLVLLVGTVVVYRQLNFIHNRNMGFDKDHLLYMPMTGEMWKKQDALKTLLQQQPLTSNYTIIDDLPTNLTSGTIDVKWDGKDPKMQVVFPSLAINENFVDVFKVKLLAGRSFSADFKGDSSNFVVNETALKVMGMNIDSAVGKNLAMWDMKGVIIGVIKDFNFKPIQHPIEPLILVKNRWGGHVVLRTTPGNINATIDALKKISATINPAYPFSYSFLDQDIANLYDGEQRLGNLFNIFAALAIFISCLGLYGLSAFMAEQRRSEIGVRKVLGASAWNIVYLLSTGFTRLVFLAVVIAIPISWFTINSWLQSFAYHVEIGWLVFVAAALAAFVIAWVTVSYESLKAAITNPVKSLKAD